MKEKINLPNIENGSATRLPLNPMVRIPLNPFNRMAGNSNQFFENFTTFKNTESRWDIKGFTKKIKRD